MCASLALPSTEHQNISRNEKEVMLFAIVDPCLARNETHVALRSCGRKRDDHDTVRINDNCLCLSKHMMAIPMERY